MAYYPVFLELKGRPCLVVGGGEVAYQKAKTLVACGARVRVVSPELGKGLQRLLRQKKIAWRRGLFKACDLDRANLVVAATDDQRVNERVSGLARRSGLLANVVDQPKLCSFVFPSVVRRGKLVLAISTGGASPALAKWIRKDLQSRYGAEFGRLLEGIARARGKVQRKVPDARRRKQLFERALRAYFRVMKEALG